MKRILLLTTFSALLFASCKEDEKPKEGYVTDDLEITQEKKAMLITGSSPTNPVNSLYEWFRILEEDYNGKKLNHIVPVGDKAHPLYNPMTDTIMKQFGIGSTPFYYVNYEETDLTEIHDDIELSLLQKPIAGVAHKVNTNDTSFIVDIKIKFFRDTAATIYVETYMVGDVAAVNYTTTGIDLRQKASQNLVANTDVKSVWDREIKDYDSTSVLIKKGDDFIYQNVLFRNAAYPFLFGKNLETYWPFGSAYAINDEIGYKSTPIRHYFLKPDFWVNEPDFEIENIRFVTVLWIVNPLTNNFEYLNSYMN